MRPLGRTGLQVSEIALGAVELGMDYGFRGSEGHWRRPEESEAKRLLARALELGINLFDTARAYGDAEEIIGRALPELPARPLLASKVQIRPDGAAENFWESLHASLRALQVETIDLLQIHYAPLDLLARDEVFEWFEEARRQGKIRFGGASFYEEPAAFAALDRPGSRRSRSRTTCSTRKWRTVCCRGRFTTGAACWCGRRSCAAC
jgi:aryl-alcohol dehydrogenase-like predicted oxidoreductase